MWVIWLFILMAAITGCKEKESEVEKTTESTYEEYDWEVDEEPNITEEYLNFEPNEFSEPSEEW